MVDDDTAGGLKAQVCDAAHMLHGEMMLKAVKNDGECGLLVLVDDITEIIALGAVINSAQNVLFGVGNNVLHKATCATTERRHSR